MHKTKSIECKQKRADCANYCNGGCVALEDTDFDYRCPFYKTKREVKKILEEIEERKKKQ